MKISLPNSKLAERDSKVVWHPFTQQKTSRQIIPIGSAEGTCIFGLDGEVYLDLISSWWVVVHGHRHPAIMSAIAKQLDQLDQIIFAGFTHEPAVALAEELISTLQVRNAPFSRVFFSDNGSTAVEVALKMALQFFRNRANRGSNSAGASSNNSISYNFTSKNSGSKDKRPVGFLALDGGYHGDTFGAMAAGRGSGFFKHFEEQMFKVTLLPVPEYWLGREDIEEAEELALREAEKILSSEAMLYSALIVEPLIQGAAGMKMYRPQFLTSLCELVREHGLLVIFDEVMTGFGRTGTLFAFEQTVVPDILCLSKGLTGGALPLAVTVVCEDFFNEFLGDNFSFALAHGHSFTANPLACAAARASLKLFNEGDALQRVKSLGQRLQSYLPLLQQTAGLEKIRHCGTVIAGEFPERAAIYKGLSEQYSSERSRLLEHEFLRCGCIIRPLGETIYLLPPLSSTDPQLDCGISTVQELVSSIA